MHLHPTVACISDSRTILRTSMWPAANKDSEWRQFSVDKSLEAIAKGDVDQRFQIMSTFIISIALERFGIKEQYEQSPPRQLDQIQTDRRFGSPNIDKS